MTGIEQFLLTKFYSKEEHPKGWEKYVYDDENIHYAILKILNDACPQFMPVLLKIKTKTTTIPKFIYKPSNGIFDIAIEIENVTYFGEVKIWSKLSEDQLARQTAYLEENNVRGFHILLTIADSDWPSEILSRKSHGKSTKISGDDLIATLDIIQSNDDSILEIVDVYRHILKELSDNRY